jgi:hypothetical protein
MKMLSLKRKVKIEKSSPTTLRWQICADDTEWKASHAQPPRPSHLPLDAVPTPDSAEAGGPRGKSWLYAIRRWLPLGIAVTLLAALGVAGWVQAQIGLAKIDREVQNAAEADLWLSLRPASFAEADRGRGEFVDEAEQVAALLETSTAGEITTRSEIAEMGDGWVRVHLHVQSGTDNNGYHQTRVYRQTDAGWQRVPPAAAYWGKAQQLETRYFIWRYFAQDDEVVKAVAPKLDLLYPDFFAALLPPAGSDKLQVQLDPERAVNGTNPVGETPPTPLQWLLIPSPSAMLLPDTLEPEAWLTQAVALSLFDHLAAAAVEEYDLPPHWAPIRDGLRLALMWDHQLPLAVWRGPLVQWALGGLHAKANISLDSPPPPLPVTFASITAGGWHQPATSAARYSVLLIPTSKSVSWHFAIPIRSRFVWCN